MTKEELITHLQDIEWEDFEAKEAKDKVPISLGRFYIQCLMCVASSILIPAILLSVYTK